MRYEAVNAKAEGVVAVEIHEGSHGWQTHVIEFFAIGTAVLRLERRWRRKNRRPGHGVRSTTSPFRGLANVGFPRKIRPCKELWLRPSSSHWSWPAAC